MLWRPPQGQDLGVRQLSAIAEVSALAARERIDVWLRGGWAMDFLLGVRTREHVDVDWFCWAEDADRLTAALAGIGFQPSGDAPPGQQRDLLRGDVDLGFALLARDAAGRVVVAGGPYAGEPWPDGMLDSPPGRLDGLTCPIIAVAAQIEIKEMMPVWVPGMVRRDKDRSDILRLRQALEAGDREAPTEEEVSVEHPNVTLLNRFYAALAGGDGATMAASYADRASFSDPLFPGLDAREVRAMWTMLTSRARPEVELSEVVADDQRGSAHWVATYPFGARTVRNDVRAAFTFADGLILTHRDEFDIHRWAGQALGAKGRLLALTPVGRRVLRRSGRQRLDEFLAARD
ncbi:nuclear transport factor 2 family protein [Micromonospora sp. NPDC050397]|uniref:nuclear transport factor 2 family protein n=1 Tax=Micromonospora sp. NPDC050397 TaxID=3364279 RepID=UPI00384BEDF2